MNFLIGSTSVFLRLERRKPRVRMDVNAGEGFLRVENDWSGSFDCKTPTISKKLEQCAVTMIGIFNIKHNAKGHVDYKSITT